MHYLNLWNTELPPEIDVSVGPINGAAQGMAQPEGADTTRVEIPAAAPPEPAPADSIAQADALTPRDMEGGEWVPFVAGECPLPPETRFFTMCEGVEAGPWIAAKGMQWNNPNVTHYRLANPVPRGPCTLPPGHPYAAAERLYMSDDTLKCWFRYGTRDWALCNPIWQPSLQYHVGHVPPKEAA